MSVSVGLEVRVQNFNLEKKEAIEDAITESSPFSLDTDSGWDQEIQRYGESTMNRSSVTEEALQECFLKPILEANEGPCTISVTVSWLDECPTDTYILADVEEDEQDEEENPPL